MPVGRTGRAYRSRFTRTTLQWCSKRWTARCARLIESEAADSAEVEVVAVSSGSRLGGRLLVMPGAVLVEFLPALEAAVQDADQSVGQLPKCGVMSYVPCSHGVVVGAGDTR